MACNKLEPWILTSLCFETAVLRKCAEKFVQTLKRWQSKPPHHSLSIRAVQPMSNSFNRVDARGTKRAVWECCADCEVQDGFGALRFCHWPEPTNAFQQPSHRSRHLSSDGPTQNTLSRVRVTHYPNSCSRQRGRSRRTCLGSVLRVAQHLEQLLDALSTSLGLDCHSRTGLTQGLQPARCYLWRDQVCLGKHEHDTLAGLLSPRLQL
mmetsp:Transcript_96443/g.267973  ORF Transcript_96443/g.267973 Transcript_96443/m.267973 type:complete len:208 (-) Transcript_96443:523-1146(-)